MTRSVAQEFTHSNPFPHLVLKDFLVIKRANNLRKALLSQPMSRKSSDLFDFLQTSDLSTPKNPVLKEFFQKLNSPEMLFWIKQTTGQSVRKASLAGFCYQSGDYLLPHDDRLEGRKIAWILNLSKGFTSKEGGCLELFATKNNKPTCVVKKIPPTYNTLTLFKVSKNSFHHVSELLTKKKRYSLGGWFYA